MPSGASPIRAADRAQGSLATRLARAHNGHTPARDDSDQETAQLRRSCARIILQRPYRTSSTSRGSLVEPSRAHSDPLGDAETAYLSGSYVPGMPRMSVMCIPRCIPRIAAEGGNLLATEEDGREVLRVGEVLAFN